MESLILAPDNQNEFSKIVLRAAHDLLMPYIPVISTSGTLMITDNMVDYFVTSFIEAMKIHTSEELAQMVNEKKTYIDVLTAPKDILTPIHLFLMSIEKLFVRITKSEKFRNSPTIHDRCTFSFEAVCANKTSAWGTSHPELTVSYEHSSLTFLGFSYGCDEINFTPHFAIDINSSLSNIFEEPLYWNVDNTTTINRMINGLTDIIYERTTVVDYLNTYPPSNTPRYSTNVIDYEGFVFYIHVSGNEWDYSKIKTQAYYKLHKIKDININYILELAKIRTAQIAFPQIRIVDSIEIGLSEKLPIIMERIQRELRTNDTLVEGLPEKARKSMAKYTEVIRFKILINQSTKWDDLCCQIFRDVMEFNFVGDYVVSLLNKIVMTNMDALTTSNKYHINNTIKNNLLAVMLNTRNTTDHDVQDVTDQIAQLTT